MKWTSFFFLFCFVFLFLFCFVFFLSFFASVGTKCCKACGAGT